MNEPNPTYEEVGRLRQDMQRHIAALSAEVTESERLRGELTVSEALLRDCRAQLDSLREALNQIADVFNIGNGVRTPSVILANVKNSARRGECLAAVERAFFTETVQDDDEGDIVEECSLNWGSEPTEYVEQFRSAISKAAS